MSANNIPNKTTALSLNQKVSAGVDAYFSKVKSLTVGGTTYTPKALLAVLQAGDDASTAVDSTRAQLAEQVATHRTAKASAAALRSELRTYILGTYGKKAVKMLGDFGMKAPKTTGKKTAQVKADAAAKALATREARQSSGHPQGQPADVAAQNAAGAKTSPQGAPAGSPTQDTATH